MAGSGLDWIAVDWGTSNMRAWAVTAAGDVLDQAQSDRGMGSLAPDEFEGVLAQVIAPWQPKANTPVIACGMVGAKQGWREAPYATTPCTPQSAMIDVPNDTGLRVKIIGGVSQATPADVMRGEETQIAGFLHLNPNWDGVICLPGTHTKWVHVSAGEIVSFQTVMTGEMFSLLSTSSVLRHSIGDGWDDAVFKDTLSDAMSRPEAMAARLFSIRAAGLLDGLSPNAARARLSGLLIGAEMAATKPYWLGQSVAIIGAQKLSDHYATALMAQGLPVTRTDADRMTLEGLKAAYAQAYAQERTSP